MPVSSSSLSLAKVSVLYIYISQIVWLTQRVMIENTVMEESELVKTYFVNIEKGGELMYERSVGCSITWKEGKNPTVRVPKKRRKDYFFY